MMSFPVMTEERAIRRSGGPGGEMATHNGMTNGSYPVNVAADAVSHSGEQATDTMERPGAAEGGGPSHSAFGSYPSAAEVDLAMHLYPFSDICDNLVQRGITTVPPLDPSIAIPADLHECAQLCALALHHRCELNNPFERAHQTSFHSSRIPGISMWDYIRRIAKYSYCSPECFIVAMVLMDRYAAMTGIPLTLRNAHRLCITAMTVSAKLRDDTYYSNAYYGSIGGVGNAELNALELELLVKVGWNTYVDGTLYQRYMKNLLQVYGPVLQERMASQPRV